MFFIVNRTNKDLTIGDLDISIGPRKAIDLEKIRSREKIDSSTDLRTCIKNGYLQVRHNSKASQTEENKEPEKVNVDDEQINKIRLAVADEVKSQIADAMKGNSGGDNSEILSKLNALLSGQGQSQSSAAYPIEDELDEDVLADIHAKRMKNVGKDTEGKVTYEKKKSTDSAVDRAAELDNLLG